MIELGRVQELMVVREKNFGVYLGQKKDDRGGGPASEETGAGGHKVGDKLKVFIYKDSEDRLIATTSMPKLELGGTAVLKVKDVSKIGAFLDMGLEKICCSRLKSRYIRFAPGKSAW
ncbi:MAG: S1-like domain-containing RNA-binding protein [Clostridium fessum]